MQDMSAQNTVACELCGEGDFDIALSNGKVIHKNCHSLLTNRQYRIERIQSLYEEQQSAMGRIKTFFGQDNIEAQIQALRQPDKRNNLKINFRQNYDQLAIDEVKNILASLYDYWPDYPPDWRERCERVKLLAGLCCVKCHSSRKMLHVHHKFSLQRGGSNKTDNLESLCIDCHGKEHHVNFRDKGAVRTISNPESKRELIDEALKTGSKLTFKYRKYNEKEGTKRTITPRKYKRVQARGGTAETLCIQGYCELRKEDRFFAIKRMYKIEIK